MFFLITLLEISSHPGLDILREFTIADTSFSVTGSRYIVLVLLFFMYDRVCLVLWNVFC